jgi:hypothetical protein
LSAPRWLTALLRQLAEEAPECLLLVAPAAHPLATTLGRTLPAARIDVAANFAQLPAQRYPTALVAEALEQLEPAAAREMLAALRDRLAAHVLVLIDGERAPLDEQELRALGYRILARDGTQLLCGFDLYDYKDRPDWLNAQSWAHPERWDQFRW